MKNTSTHISSLCAWLVPCLFGLVLFGCGPEPEQQPAPASCTPTCEGRVCGDDGCGGSCGTCPEGDICTNEGQCYDTGSGTSTSGTTSDTSGCSETCADLGWSCGEVCGTSCGTCADNQMCDDGACVCAPQCNGKVCGDDDGCGGTCSPCPTDVSCQDCGLALQIVERQESNGQLQSVTVALDYNPAEGTTMPQIADLRLRVQGPANLSRVGIGEGLLQSEKNLVESPSTGLPYQVLPNNTFQFLVLSSANSNPIQRGRWLFLRFTIGDTSAEGPVQFSLVKREQIFAPPEADSVLWNLNYDSPVVVWPEVRNASE